MVIVGRHCLLLLLLLVVQVEMLVQQNEFLEYSAVSDAVDLAEVSEVLVQAVLLLLLLQRLLEQKVLAGEAEDCRLRGRGELLARVELRESQVKLAKLLVLLGDLPLCPEGLDVYDILCILFLVCALQNDGALNLCDQVVLLQVDEGTDFRLEDLLVGEQQLILLRLLINIVQLADFDVLLELLRQVKPRADVALDLEGLLEQPLIVPTRVAFLFQNRAPLL